MTIRTALNLFRCLTARRLWNLLLVFLSFSLSSWTGRRFVWGRPFSLTVEPTNRCNLKCPECPSGNGAMTRPQGLLSFDAFTSMIDDVHKDTCYLQLFFQGEPFINNRLVDMIAYAHSRAMYVSISTNAHYLRDDIIEGLLDAGLDKLIISIDGLRQDVYEQYRVGGSLDRVIDALRRLDRARRVKARRCRTDVLLQMLVTRQTEEDIPALRELARSVRAGVSLKSIQVYSLEGARRYLPENPAWRRYDIVDGELRIKSRLDNRCSRLWIASVITWDGVVLPCCFDKDAEYALGSLADTSFHEVWRSGAYESFRSRILADRRGVDMCRNCTEGLKIYR
jgi:radical SAM protein with 4Fe4S-binding SPASM domain